MIETLTPEQEAMLAVYRDKWLAIGTQTESPTPPSTEQVRPLVDAAYEQAGRRAPKHIIFGDSPKHIAKLAYEKAIDEGVITREKSFKEYYVGLNFSYGQHDAYWLAFYEYMSEVLGLKDAEKLRPLMELSKLTGWQLFFEDYAFLSRRPTVLHRNAAGQLHKDGGPALEYADGTKLFRLNGVEMPEHIVMTPAYQLNSNELHTITNVEVRREFVRKIGVQKLLADLGARVIDEQTIITGLDQKEHFYQLVLLNLGDRERPYLKMLNPSINTFHIEGVPPGTKTVMEALQFRNGGNSNSPLVLT